MNVVWQSLSQAFLMLLVFQGHLALNAADPELGPPVDVAFVSKLDGTTQHYVVRLPKVDFDKHPLNVLIALHGHGSDRWQFINDTRDECRASRDIATQYGMIYVSPDYRAKTSWMGPAADADLRQIIDELNSRYRIDNIIVCGGSMGGTSALAFAAMHPTLIDGAISMNGTANLVEYTGFPDAIAESYGGTKAQKPDEYRNRSAELFPDRLTMPIAMTTGGRDTLVPPDSSLRLAKQLEQRGASVKLIHRPEGGHQTSYDDAIEAHQFVIQKVLDLKKPKPPVLALNRTPRKVVCLGDSVTGVYYHTGGRRAYPEMLELALRRVASETPITVINAGISGNTTRDGLDRLERDVLSHKPDLVTISFGLNDMTRIPPDTFRSNLESLIQQCRERNAQVVLCTPNAVIDTSGRPIEKLNSYCQIIRDVGKDRSAPVCDQYLAGNRLKERAPWTWRLTLSDEIHPNMDGHKRMAEELCRTITGQVVSLAAIVPPRPALQHVMTLLNQKKPVKVLAMTPYDTMIADAIKSVDPSATIEVTAWSTGGKSLVELEAEAKSQVRAFKPDLVVLSVPREAAADSDEQYVKSQSWIMNWSLSFGIQEWDGIVIHPSVIAPTVTGPKDDLYRQLVWAQHLELIDAASDNTTTAQQRLAKWMAEVGMKKTD